MINYRLVIKCWGEGGIRVLTLNVLATTDDFMSVDHKAFKTAVWKALDGTKNPLFIYALAQFSQAAGLSAD